MLERSIRVIRAAVIALLAGLAAAVPAAAVTPVDPNTLNPAPPDFFNAACERTGSHIVCTLHFDTVDDVFDEPSGVICDGTELLFSQQRAVVGKRFYDADGDLLRRHFRESLTGDFTNPETGKVATWTQHNTVKHDLGTPGVIPSGFTSFTGNLRVIGPDGATLFVDAGHVVIDEATGEIARSSGPHHFDDYFVNGDTAALAPLCEALA